MVQSLHNKWTKTLNVIVPSSGSVLLVPPRWGPSSPTTFALFQGRGRDAEENRRRGGAWPPPTRCEPRSVDSRAASRGRVITSPASTANCRPLRTLQSHPPSGIPRRPIRSAAGRTRLPFSEA
jgi:hypothetical protein